MNDKIFMTVTEELEELSSYFKFGKLEKKKNILNSLKDFQNENQIIIEGINQDKLDLEEKLEKAELAKQNISIKYDLISNILSAKRSKNQGLDEFNKVFHAFLEFANDESSVANEAEMLLSLQGIEKELILITNFSNIYNKNIIAIGGGFSSGKSSFVSSFFTNSSISLPIGINPVTAIPTYIVSGGNSIRGYSNEGGSFEINTHLYEELSHDFVKSFKFNLKNIMPVMAIQTPLEGFESICFIDTPGYDPASSDGYTSDDRETAYQFIQQANSLLWLVGLDANGTIPESDLSFLEDQELDDKNLYIIANKADLRAESDIEDIIDEIAESLEDYDIEYVGISAYSSNQKKEYLYKNISLNEFLQSENKPAKLKKDIQLKISQIINTYRKSIKKDLDNQKHISSSFKSIELDLLESGYEYTTDQIKDDGFSKILEENKLEERLLEIRILWSKHTKNKNTHNLFFALSYGSHDDDLKFAKKRSRALTKTINVILKTDVVKNHPVFLDYLKRIKKYLSKVNKEPKKKVLNNFIETVDEALEEVKIILNDSSDMNNIIVRICNLQKSLETSKTKKLGSQLIKLDALEKDFHSSINNIFSCL